MPNQKRYYVKNSVDILNSVDFFCDYYEEINKYIGNKMIKSSLDRGTFSHPKQILSDEILGLLGKDRNKISYAYGKESGEKLIREKICVIDNIKFKTDYTIDDVAIVAGAWSGVELVLEELAHLKNGKAEKITVAVIGPTHYQLFHRAINILGLNIVGFDFTKSNEDSVPVDMNDIKDILEINPQVIFITNPNNPNGEYISSNILENLVKICEQNNIYLVIDEIQDFFCIIDCKGLDYGNWIQSPNVIRIDSFSKKRGLAEYRVGWIVADKTILGNRLTGIIGRLSGLMGNAPRAANTAIFKLLEFEEDRIKNNIDHLKIYWDELLQREQYILSKLEKIPRVKIRKRQACINLTIQIDSSYSDFQFAKALMDEGTLMMPCSGYGYRPEDSMIRITFSERWNKIEHAMKSFEKVIKKI